MIFGVLIDIIEIIFLEKNIDSQICILQKVYKVY